MRNCLIMTALLGLSFIQCSKADEPPPKYPDGPSFCNGMAAAECNANVIQACLASSKDLCVATRQANCTDEYITPALNLGHTYDSKQAETCVTEVGNAYSDAKITAAEYSAIAEACDLVFSGSGAKASLCTNNSDCKQSDGLRCVVHGITASDAGAAEGSCQLPVSVSAGNPCSSIDAECTDGFHCDGAHCVADETAGANCSVADPCASGLQCSAAGKCTSKLADGTTCALDSECEHGICVAVVNLCGSVDTLAPNEPFCQPLHP